MPLSGARIVMLRFATWQFSTGPLAEPVRAPAKPIT